MATIEKKIWPRDFEELNSGKRNIEVRLADFDLKEGDIIAFREWDPKKKKFTGKEIYRVVKYYKKFDLVKFYELKYLKKGIYVIEFEK